MKDQSRSLGDICSRTKQAALKLAMLDTDAKNTILLAIANHIKKNRRKIEASNSLDVAAAREMVAKGTLTQPLLNRLVLSDDKIEQLSIYLEEVAKLDDPVGKKQYVMKLDENLILERVSCPIGAMAVIFESRPEVVVQVTALSLKSGNAVILKGGSEAVHSNRILFQLIAEVLREFDLEGCVDLIETREDVADLLKQDRYIDLIIPRGSNEFVKYIQDNTKIPVMGHSAGICHIYIDEQCDPQKAIRITLDAKTNSPSTCNALETLLIHEKAVPAVFADLLEQLEQSHIKLIGCAKTQEYARKLKHTITAATEDDWSTEYLDLVLSIKIVSSLEEAIHHINTFGSHHTDSIATEDPYAAESFLQRVDSACVFHNVSTRFSDGYVFGLGAEVGISTNKTHARGPVGLEGLVIYKYLLRGDGHIRKTYSGKDARPFLHLPLPAN